MIDEDRISQIVQMVLENIEKQNKVRNDSYRTKENVVPDKVSDRGIFKDLNTAMEECKKAQAVFEKLPIEKRKKIIEAIRNASIDNAERLAKMAVECTGYGRWEHKKIKNINAATLTPGVEDLPSKVMTGDNGAVFIERLPMGLIVALTPATHPAALVINNIIAMLAGGNSVYICPHPSAQRASLETIRVINDAITRAGGPENLVVAIDKVDIPSVEAACKHPLVNMVSATGGPAVGKVALTSGKRALAAGPGNPPVLVDETANLKKAAKDIMDGATFDNNILCIAEKEIFAVNKIADELLYELSSNKAYILNSKEAEKVTSLVVEDGHVNKKYIGKNVSLILKDAGISVPDDTLAAIMDVSFTHPLVGLEQMMPVIPLVRCSDFEEALTFAKKAEQGYGHTAMIHSMNVNRITMFGREMKVILMVANAPSYASLNVDGEGHYTHTISDTGEGVCTPVDFTREHRFIVGGSLRFA